jgi:hypothetical protein
MEVYRSGIPLTCVETGIIIARHVPRATHRIINVIAEPWRICPVLATAEAKLVGSDEILPREKSIGKLSRVKLMNLSARTVHSWSC